MFRSYFVTTHPTTNIFKRQTLLTRSHYRTQLPPRSKNKPHLSVSQYHTVQPTKMHLISPLTVLILAAPMIVATPTPQLLWPGSCEGGFLLCCPGNPSIQCNKSPFQVENHISLSISNRTIHWLSPGVSQPPSLRSCMGTVACCSPTGSTVSSFQNRNSENEL